MLAFEFRVFRLGERYFALLPKLNAAQMNFLLARLRDKGFAIAGGSRPMARGKHENFHIDPMGLCWSTVDPSDAIGPVIPNLLRLPKEVATLRTLREYYFSVRRSATSAVVRFSTRIESSSPWDGLRATGESGLTPDEHMVVSYVVMASSESCRLVTDFPTENSRVKMVGKKQYFESTLSPKEAASTLRSIARKGARNSYLPRNGILTFDSFRPPQRSAQAELFDSLGEWCYFMPTNLQKL